MRRTRPRSPVPSGVDPLIWADEALRELVIVRQCLGAKPLALERLLHVEELIRWLATGPD